MPTRWPVRTTSVRERMIELASRDVAPAPRLEEAEFNARRDAEQMAKALSGLHDALVKIEAIHEETWTKQNFSTELTRALTTIENARMEWNAARLKLPVLSGASSPANSELPDKTTPAPALFGACSFAQLCRLGFALTWPVAVVLLAGWAVLVAVLLRH